MTSRRLKRVLITGGAGFIGSHLCHRLLDEGCEVVVFDNLLTGRVANIDSLLGHERFSFQHYDVTNYLYVDGPLDVILHFASPASPADFEKLPIQILKVGSLGTHKALGLAKAKGARILIASTSECYGDPEVNPQPETYWGNVRIARIFNTFGPRMQLNDGRAIPNFFRQAILGEDVTLYGDGSQTRSFCYVDDLVEGIWRLLRSSYVGPVNLGNPNEMSLREMAEKVISITGSRSQIVSLPLPPDDPKVRRPNIDLAQRVLDGWEPKVTVADGLERTHEYFMAELERGERSED